MAPAFTLPGARETEIHFQISSPTSALLTEGEGKGNLFDI